jgi:hypothetical protein
MTRDELEAWLCGGAGSTQPTADEIAAILGGPLGVVSGAPLRRVARRLDGVRFTVAVLRDAFGDDGEVRRWLLRPRGELGGLCGMDLLWAGQPAAVEELAVREWHRPGGALTGAA